MKRESSFLQISFKGYIHGNSYIHRLDARAKIFISTIIIAASLLTGNPVSLIILIVFELALISISGIKYSYIFSPIPPLLPFLFIAVLFRLFTHPQLEANSTFIDTIWKWKIFIITENSLIGTLILLFRFFVIFILFTLFSATTRLEDFTKGIERIVKPLQKVGIPAHEFSMVISIAIGFFHILVNEMNRIIKAQVSRGAEFETGRFQLVKKVKKLSPLIVPLFSFSLEHSKHLVEAMESRCYRGGKGRTYFTITKYSARDYISMIISILVISLSIIIVKFVNPEEIKKYFFDLF